MRCTIDNKIASFTAAGVYPLKLLKNRGIIINDKIVPYHIQLSPTNKCNLKCSFCSCANREKTEELPFTTVLDFMRTYRHLGCKSVTISGGGDPLLHKDINAIIRGIYRFGISIGLVSNGVFFGGLARDSYSCITWIRISFADDREFNSGFEKTLRLAVDKGKNVDWAFSYVLSSAPNLNNLKKCVEFANKHDFTHIRLVSDLLDLENIPSMVYIKRELEKLDVSDELVIYQGRKKFTSGRKRCLISLLKPVVSARGEVFPCCGVQYALENPGLDYEASMCMGTIRDIEEIYESQKCFDGSVCARCYYSDYNDTLGILTKDVEHLEFV